jgi:hypothetical protein
MGLRETLTLKETLEAATPRKRWATVWTDGSIHSRHWLRRMAENASWSINRTSESMGAATRTRVARLDQLGKEQTDA